MHSVLMGMHSWGKVVLVTTTEEGEPSEVVLLLSVVAVLAL